MLVYTTWNIQGIFLYAAGSLLVTLRIGFLHYYHFYGNSRCVLILLLVEWTCLDAIKTQRSRMNSADKTVRRGQLDRPRSPEYRCPETCLISLLHLAISRKSTKGHSLSKGRTFGNIDSHNQVANEIFLEGWQRSPFCLYTPCKNWELSRACWQSSHALLPSYKLVAVHEDCLVNNQSAIYWSPCMRPLSRIRQQPLA